MADDAAPLMHVDWIRWFEELKRAVERPASGIAPEQITMTAPHLLGRTTVGTGPAEEISVSGPLTLSALTLGITGSALTRVDDTNVTLTLGGAPSAALLAAVSLTLGWTGTLGVARGGTNIASYAVGDLLYASAATTLSKLADVAAGSYLRSGGVTTAPVWSTLTLPNSAATGDLFYASGANAMTLRTIGTAADVLTVSGGLPVWAAPAAAATTVITDDTTTNATMFLTWVTAASGSLPLKVTSTKLTFNPSTGTLSTPLAVHSTSLSSPLHISTGAIGITPGAGTNLNVTLSTTGDFAVNTDQFYVDTSLARVGIGTASPTSLLHVRSTSAFPTLNIESTTANGGILQLTSSTNNWQVYGGANGTLRMEVSSAPSGVKLLLSNNGLLQLGTTANISTATFALFLGDGTAPTGGIMPANTSAHYTDTFGAAAPFCIDVNGITMRLTPAARARSTAQVAAVASVATFTLGATDTSFRVSANVNVTSSTTHNFTVTCAYTDETNTAITLTLTFSQATGVFLTAITNVTGTGPYSGLPIDIRCKASTAITIATVGVFTSVVYNVEGIIQQLS